MVAYHQLVRPEESRVALARLLEQKETLPARYLQLAQLIGRDLAALQDESLDHIARRMNDVRRRLELGRAGDQVLIGLVNVTPLHREGEADPIAVVAA